jgi:hypothetical protein
VRQALQEAAESDHLQQLLGVVPVPAAGPTEDLHRQQDVVQDTAPGQQGRALEHEGDVTTRSGDGRASDLYRTSGRLDQAGDDAQQGGLPAARTPDDSGELTLVDPQVQAV